MPDPCNGTTGRREQRFNEESCRPSKDKHLEDDIRLEERAQVAAGDRNRDIAAKLFIAEETVKVHIKHIMDKLNANDRTQSVAIAVRRGIIQL
jgi:DNA-binding NarL/FixJ family response regulator